MYEAQCAVVGTVITNPIKRQTASGEEVLSFRVASNARRQDRNTGEWTSGGTLFLTVTCWRRLVKGVGGSLMKGDAVIAYGQLRTNEYTTRDGVDRTDLEMNASAVGPDLARCIVKVERARPVAAAPSYTDLDRTDGDEQQDADDRTDGEQAERLDEDERDDLDRESVADAVPIGA